MGSMEEGYDHSAMDSHLDATDMPAPRAVAPGSRHSPGAGPGVVEGGRGFGTKDRLDSAFRVSWRRGVEGRACSRDELASG
jgi:hypothetical protein